MIDRPSPNHSARSATIRAVCIHASAGGLAGDLGWLQNPASKVSYHVLIALDGTAYRLVSDERAAWHAGFSVIGPYSPATVNFNRVSLGVAASHPNDGKTPYPLAQVKGVAAVVAGWLRAYPTIEAVVSHAAADRRKNDPRGWPWGAFWAYVREAS